MLRVLLSSTYRDLIGERAAVIDVVSAFSSRHRVSVVAMEQFGSQDATPLAISRQAAEAADLAIVILGSRYGSTPPDEALSFSESEYEVLLRGRIPILAYVSEDAHGVTDAQFVRFRARIAEDRVESVFTSIEHLRQLVYQDLKRELSFLVEEGDSTSILSPRPGWTGPSKFVGRDKALLTVAVELRQPGARVAVCGPPGIGKTSFARELFSGQYDVSDGRWARADEIFGRDPSGRLRLSTHRLTPRAAATAIRGVLDAVPDAILVIDNVQCAPRECAYVARDLGDPRVLFLSWDAGQLPPCSKVVHLGPLSPAQSRTVLESVRGRHRDWSDEAVDELAELLGHHPLALEFASRRLLDDSLLTLGELIAELGKVNAALQLQGDTLDRTDVVVRQVLLTSYQQLSPAERRSLALLAAPRRVGISTASAAWAETVHGINPATRLLRARQLGLIEASSIADHLGHQFRFRALPLDLLATVDAADDALSVWSARNQTDEALRDESIDVVTDAVLARLHASSDTEAQASWLKPLLTHPRPALRWAIERAVRATPTDAALRTVVEVLAVPQVEPIGMELASLVGDVGWAEAENVLIRIWRHPEVRIPNDPDVNLVAELGAAAVKALSAIRRVPVADLIDAELATGRVSRISQALDVLPWLDGADLRSRVRALLRSPSAELAVLACETFGELDPSPEDAEALWQCYLDDADGDVGSAAVRSLGIWRDERAVAPLIAQLDDSDDYVRAGTISVLWRYPRPEVLDELVQLARSDPSPDVRQMALWASATNHDPRSLELLTVALQDRTLPPNVALTSLSIALSMDGVNALSRDRAIAAVRPYLVDTIPEVRISARVTILSAGDLTEAMNGFWTEAFDGSTSGPWRAMLIVELASHVGPHVDLENIEEEIEQLLVDDEPAVRAAGALLAGQVRYETETLIRRLHELEADDSPCLPLLGTVAEQAGQALMRIAGTREPWRPHRGPAFT